MRSLAVALVVAGCSFRPLAGAGDATGGSGDGGAGMADGRDAPAIDAAPALAFCPGDSHLRLCFSFDQASFPASLPNEGAVVVDAAITNVTPTGGVLGGAALLGASSEIFVPTTAAVTNIQAAEVWFRIDSDPAVGARSGLFDTNIVPPNISLFVNNNGADHTLRCGMGSQTEIWTAAVTAGPWFYAACVCDGANLVMYLDGVSLGARPGACATGGEIFSDGMVIGANNNGASAINDRLIGALDGLRLWDVTLTATAVCQAAGLPSC